MLDKYCSDSPVVLFSKEYHVSMLNTHALLYYKVPFSLEGVELDGSGLPTGIFRRNANYVLRSNVLRSLPDEFRMEAIHLAMSRLLENGITTVAAIEGGWLFDDRDAEFIYAHSGEFPVDMPLFYQTMDLAKVWKLGLRRVGGNIMVDGTLSSHSAALSAPYADRPDYRGQIFLPQDGLDEFVQQCYRQDMQLALYSIGDRAIESVLLAHERAIRQGGSTALRHRIEHCVIVDPDLIERMAKMNICPVLHTGMLQMLGKNFSEFYGPERNKYLEAVRSMLDAGIHVALHSDAPSGPVGVQVIDGAVNRYDRSKNFQCNRTQAVSVREAIRCYTLNSAYAAHEDHIKGSIEVGKLADLIILSDDILAIDPMDIHSLKVDLTMIDGVVEYQR